MCQRVFLAMASLLEAGILIADEPFASVDSPTRQRLAELVRDWMKTRGVILLLVSHDLDLLRYLTDQTLVIYRGQVAEMGTTADGLARGKSIHPYTWLLEQVAGADGRPMLQVGTAIGRASSPCCFAPRCCWAEPTICVE